MGRWAVPYLKKNSTAVYFNECNEMCLGRPKKHHHNNALEMNIIAL